MECASARTTARCVAGGMKRSTSIPSSSWSSLGHDGRGNNRNRSADSDDDDDDDDGCLSDRNFVLEQVPSTCTYTLLWKYDGPRFFIALPGALNPEPEHLRNL